MNHELHTEIDIEAPPETVRLMKKSLDTGTAAGFDEMNDALKARAEHRYGTRR